MNHDREEEHAYHELEPVLYNSVDQIMPSSDSEVHIYDESDEPFAYEYPSLSKVSLRCM